jgi:hypothetical protein
MKGKDFLVKQIQDASIKEIVRVANCLNICANEFFHRTYALNCRYFMTKDISECERCWQYALETDQD